MIGFLVGGLSIGQLYQGLYARAWGVQVGFGRRPASLHDLVLRLSAALLALMTVSASELRADGWLDGPPRVDRRLDDLLALDAALPAPSYDLDSFTPARSAARNLRRRGARSAPRRSGSGPGLNQDAKAFGSFGVVIALFAYILIVVTISMVCGVFAPVWAEWRHSERAGNP